MKHETNANRIPPLPGESRPYAMLGAGEIVSSLWKEGDPNGGWRYHFNLFQMSSASGQVSQVFRPEDVPNVLKLLRLLAFTLFDDGCLEQGLRDDLGCLSSCLDDVLGQQLGHRPGLLNAYQVQALADVLDFLWNDCGQLFRDRPREREACANVKQLRRWLERNRSDQSTIHRQEEST